MVRRQLLISLRDVCWNDFVFRGSSFLLFQMGQLRPLTEYRPVPATREIPKGSN